MKVPACDTRLPVVIRGHGYGSIDRNGRDDGSTSVLDIAFTRAHPDSIRNSTARHAMAYNLALCFARHWSRLHLPVDWGASGIGRFKSSGRHAWNPADGYDASSSSSSHIRQNRYYQMAGNDLDWSLVEASARVVDSMPDGVRSSKVHSDRSILLLCSAMFLRIERSDNTQSMIEVSCCLVKGP